MEPSLPSALWLRERKTVMKHIRLSLICAVLALFVFAACAFAANGAATSAPAKASVGGCGGGCGSAAQGAAKSSSGGCGSASGGCGASSGSASGGCGSASGGCGASTAVAAVASDPVNLTAAQKQKLASIDKKFGLSSQKMGDEAVQLRKEFSKLNSSPKADEQRLARVVRRLTYLQGEMFLQGRQRSEAVQSVYTPQQRVILAKSSGGSGSSAGGCGGGSSSGGCGAGSSSGCGSSSGGCGGGSSSGGCGGGSSSGSKASSGGCGGGSSSGCGASGGCGASAKTAASNVAK
jgi:Spy/CpxP family protein refolding chaperone